MAIIDPTGTRTVATIVTPLDAGELQGRWEACCRGLGTPEARQDIFEQLVTAYARPDRHYHDLRHIAGCLAELNNTGQSPTNPQALELAIWFHDVVYDGRRQDNEERSADVAEAALRRLGVEEILRREVRELILLTRHDKVPPTIDGKLMVDIDLAGLGVAAEVFDANGLAIRQEYSHVSDAEFRRGRATLLGRFLERPRIYYTDAFHDRYEKQARANLGRALAAL